MKDFDLKIIGTIGEHTLRELLYIAKDKKELSIFIYTSGGSVEVATCIKDYIEHHKIKVTITCGGRCESAGTIILSAGTKKKAYKNCVFMFHEMTAIDEQTNKVLQDESRHKKLNFFKEMYAKLYPTIKLDKDSNKHKYMTAKEMFVEGLIDEILL